jgi:WD40 repeat protein
VWFGLDTGEVDCNSASFTVYQNSTVSDATTAHSSPVNAIVHINANQVATASNDGTIKVWNVNTKSLVYTYYGHWAAIQALVILPGGLLASCSYDQSVIIWNFANNTARAYNMSNTINHIKLHTIYTNFLLVSTSTNISIYNASSNMSLINSVSIGGDVFYCFEIIKPSGNLLALGNVITHFLYPNLTQIFRIGVQQTTWSALLLPDNLTLITGGDNGLISVFNMSVNGYGPGYNVHSGKIDVLMMTPDQIAIISGSYNGNQFIMWTWTTMNLQQIVNYVTFSKVYSAAVIPSTFNGSKIIFSTN